MLLYHAAAPVEMQPATLYQTTALLTPHPAFCQLHSLHHQTPNSIEDEGFVCCLQHLEPFMW